MTAMEQIAALADVPVEVEAELDRRLLSIRKILDLEVGSVIGMSRAAGENLDIYAGGTLVGYGEIVIVENSISIRLTRFRTAE